MLIKSFEGFRSRAAQRADGRWVIGYGHTLSAREGLKVTEGEAELLLQYDLIPVVKAVSAIPAALNQHQFDALASFVLSVGVERFEASDVLDRLNADAHAEAADALIAWTDDRAVDAPPRRRAERALFVAAPDAAVTLADLLAAPLPFPTELELRAFDGSLAAEEDAAEIGSTAPDVPSSAPDVAPFPPTRTFDDEAQQPPASAAPPVTGAAVTQLHSPYAIKMTGPLPGVGERSIILGGLDHALAPANDVAVSAGAIVQLTPPALQVETDPAAIAPPAEAPDTSAAPSFAPAEPSPVLTGSAAGDEQTGPASGVPADFVIPSLDTPLAAHDPHLSVGDRRRARRAKPAKRFDAANTAPIIIMGLIGLVSLGAAMAAFRRAAVSNGDDTAMIAWVLAIIAAACLGVSSFNLWQRWGQADRA